MDSIELVIRIQRHRLNMHNSFVRRCGVDFCFLNPFLLNLYHHNLIGEQGTQNRTGIGRCRPPIVFAQSAVCFPFLLSLLRGNTSNKTETAECDGTSFRLMRLAFF